MGSTISAVMPLFALLLAQPAGSPELDASIARARELARQVTIRRDEYGTPHIHAATDAGAVMGGIYARAEDEMARIESGHAQSIGLAAKYSGVAGIPSDRFILAFEVPTLARREYESSPPEVRALADAAADGLNLYQHLHPEYHPKAIERWEPWMFYAREYAWTLYHAQQQFQHMRPAGAAPAAEAADDESPAEPAADAAGEQPKEPDGSNAWAIGPSRTKSGRAMLYLNPHIPLDEVYEMELWSDEGLHVSGMVAYGGNLLPCLGFNEHLGWSLTVNYPDIADAYAIRFDIPGDPLAYRHGEEIRHAVKWTGTIQVRTEAGMEDRELTFYKTHHGPVLYESGGISYAVRTAKIEELRAFEQWYRMCKASTLEEWKSAISMFSVVFHNFVYADDKGNIGYIYNAAFPVREPGLNWSGVLDGSDPKTDWRGYHALGALPQVWNPSAGYLLSCNSPPFSVTAEGQNPDKSTFPADMIGTDLNDGRIAMSHDLLSHASAWTLDELERAAFDTKVYAMEASRKGLLADHTALTATSPEKAARIAPAVELIRDWDGRLALDSVPSTLFMVWLEKLYSPQWRPRRAAGDLSAALAETMTELERDFGDWRVPWGDINRHQRFHTSAGIAVSDDRPSLPIVGGHGGMGVSFCYLSRATGTKRRYGYHGHSYVGAVEFGDEPMVRSIVPFGASRDPASPHYADQAALYASGKLKKVTFGAAAEPVRDGRSYHPGE